jgi:hypothetical protein
MDYSSMNNDELRDWLAYHDRSIANAQMRYGHSTLGSDRSLLAEVYDRAYPCQQEAKRRGVTSSRLADILSKMSDQSLTTLYRCAKSRASHWFSDPKAMMVLRRICQRRGLIE